MHYSTNLMTFNESKSNTIQDYSSEVVPLRNESLIFVWLDIANYSRTGLSGAWVFLTGYFYCNKIIEKAILIF